MSEQPVRVVTAARASAILYRLSIAHRCAGPYLLPANVCPVVPLALISAGREFRFVDIEPIGSSGALGMDRERALQLVAEGSEQIGGVVYVRPYGALRDESDFFRRLRRASADLLLVDDRCLCYPRPARDPREDSQGAGVTLYSTGYSKPVDMGYGGFAFLFGAVGYDEFVRRYDAGDLRWITELYRRRVREKAPIYRGSGIPAKLEELHWLDLRAAGIEWAEYRQRIAELLEPAREHRRRLNAIYRSIIPGDVLLGPAYDGWRFQVLVPERDALLETIFDRGFFASDHYFPASTLFGGRHHPAAEALHRRVLNLFNDHRFDAPRARCLAECVADHVARHR